MTTKETPHFDIKAMTAARRKGPAPTFLFPVRGYEIGVDEIALGLKEGEPISLVFRPFTADEMVEAMDTAKEFEGGEYIRERNKELAIKCLVTPKLGNDAESRALLDNWLPGTLGNFGEAMYARSGYHEYTVTSAKDALKNS